jgi:hypothetical protein
VSPPGFLDCGSASSFQSAVAVTAHVGPVIGDNFCVDTKSLCDLRLAVMQPSQNQQPPQPGAKYAALASIGTNFCRNSSVSRIFDLDAIGPSQIATAELGSGGGGTAAPIGTAGKLIDQANNLQLNATLQLAPQTVQTMQIGDVDMPGGIGPTIGSGFLQAAYNVHIVSLRRCGRDLRSIGRSFLRDNSANLTRVILPHHRRLDIGRYFCGDRRVGGPGSATTGGGSGGNEVSAARGAGGLLVLGLSRRTLERYVARLLKLNDLSALDQLSTIVPREDLHRIALLMLTNRRAVNTFLRLFEDHAFARVKDLRGGRLAGDRDLTLLHWAIACFPHHLPSFTPSLEDLRQQTTLKYNVMHYAAVYGINATSLEKLLAHVSAQNVRDLEAEAVAELHSIGTVRRVASAGGGSSWRVDSDEDADDEDRDGLVVDGPNREFGHFDEGNDDDELQARFRHKRRTDHCESGADENEDEEGCASSAVVSDSARDNGPAIPQRGDACTSKPRSTKDASAAVVTAATASDAEKKRSTPPPPPPPGGTNPPPTSTAPLARSEDSVSPTAAADVAPCRPRPSSPSSNASVLVAVPRNLSQTASVLEMSSATDHGSAMENAARLLEHSSPVVDSTQAAVPIGASSREAPSRAHGTATPSAGASRQEFPSPPLSANMFMPTGTQPGVALLLPRDRSVTPLHLALAHRHYDTALALLRARHGYEADPTKRASKDASIALLRISGVDIDTSARGTSAAEKPSDRHEVDIEGNAKRREQAVPYGAGNEPIGDVGSPNGVEGSGDGNICAQVAPANAEAMLPLDAMDLTLLHWSAASESDSASASVITTQCSKIIQAMEDPKGTHIDKVKERFEHRFHLAHVWPSFAFFLAFLTWLLIASTLVEAPYSTAITTNVEVEIKQCLPRQASQVEFWVNFSSKDTGFFCPQAHHAITLLEIVLEERVVVQDPTGVHNPSMQTRFRPTRVGTLRPSLIDRARRSGVTLYVHSLRLVTNVLYTGPDAFYAAWSDYESAAPYNNTPASLDDDGAAHSSIRSGMFEGLEPPPNVSLAAEGPAWLTAQGGGQSTAVADGAVVASAPDSQSGVVTSQQQFRVYTEFVLHRPMEYRLSYVPAFGSSAGTMSTDEVRAFVKPIPKSDYAHAVLPATPAFWHAAGSVAAAITGLCWLAASVDVTISATHVVQRIRKRKSRLLRSPTTASIAVDVFIAALQVAICVQMTILARNLVTMDSHVLRPKPEWVHADLFSTIQTSLRFLTVAIAVPALRFARHLPSVDVCVTVTATAGALVAAGAWCVMAFLVPAHRVEAVAARGGITTPSLSALNRNGLMTILTVVGAFWVPVLLLRRSGLPSDASRQWWSDTLNLELESQRQERLMKAPSTPTWQRVRWRVMRRLYGRLARHVTNVVACGLLVTLYATCAVIFLIPYTVDTPLGADPSSSVANEDGAAAGPLSGAALTGLMQLMP